MSEEYITVECIVSEYLNNWFTYEELAEYLCIDLETVMNSLLYNPELDDKTKMKITHHTNLIDRYYSAINSDVETFYMEDDHIVVDIANYIIENEASLRETARYFEIGKTTVFDYIHERLPIIDIVKYKQVFDVLMANKSFSTNNKKVIEQVLKSYDYLAMGFSSEEIQEAQGLGRNVIQRNLTTRLKKIDQEKYEIAKDILTQNQLTPLKENAFQPHGK